MRRLGILFACLVACAGGRVPKDLPRARTAVHEAREGRVPIASIDRAEGVGLVAGPDGHLGAWLALGPFRLEGPASLESARPLGASVDEAALSPRFAEPVAASVDRPVRAGGKIVSWSKAPAAWGIAKSARGPIDLDATFDAGGRAAIGYLGTTLRLPSPRALLLSLAIDDGCELFVDGRSVFRRDDARPLRDDDDLVPLDLSAGDHVLLLKLRQRGGAWTARARLIDETFAPPSGVRILLPGTPPEVGKELAGSMAQVSIAPRPTARGWAIDARIRYPEGAPIGIPLGASARILGLPGELTPPPRSLGEVTIDARAPSEIDTRAFDFGTEFEGTAAQIVVTVAGRPLEVPFRPITELRNAIDLAGRAREVAAASDVVATLDHLRERLRGQIEGGDRDLRAQLADAAFLTAFAKDVLEGRDPIAARTGPLRLAHLAAADRRPQPVAVYVPKGDPKPRSKPLFVALHGMNGGPVSMMRIFFGGNEPSLSMADLDRSFGVRGDRLPPLDAFVIAPHAHGNAMYRQLGEAEVLDAIEWAIARWPAIDPDRIHVTGFSMGGTGAAAIPLHHPDRFASAQPLCGYHDYELRRDLAGRPRRPWEQAQIEERSNVAWADNGARLPLWVVHGLQDTPVRNSRALVEAWTQRGFFVRSEEPDLGHDVWGYTYAGLRHVSWFSGRKRDPHPRTLSFRTTRPRFGTDAWIHVDALSDDATPWATVDAKIVDRGRIAISTRGVARLRVDRDPVLVDDDLEISIDGAKIRFPAGVPIELSREGTFHAGPPKAAGPRKEGRITGPIRDVWSEPLAIVYGASDPEQTRVNRQVAEALAAIRPGVDVRYPILRDLDGEPPADRSLILVGNARSNAVLRALEPSLPIRVAGGAITFAGRTFTGPELGAAFVVPHPKGGGRYLLVVEGATALGTLRALSLPELLPDFVIWDARLAPARGQQVLGDATVLAAGNFDARWRPPATIGDPLARP